MAMGDKTRVSQQTPPRPRPVSLPLPLLMRTPLPMPRSRQNRRLLLRRTALALCSALVLYYCLAFIAAGTRAPEWAAGAAGAAGAADSPLSARWRQRRPVPPQIRTNLSLDEEQCRSYFPGLTKEIDDVVAEGPFVVKQTGDLGPLQGRIRDGQIYIIHAQRKSDLSEEMLNSRSASLHQLHRALVTSPTPLPDTVFTLNFQDQPFGTSWTYSRHADPAFRPADRHARSFLMPHFSFWAWKLPFVGSVSRAAAAVDRLEASYIAPRGSWRDKIPRAVWRGTTWFNSVHNPRLRQNLLAAAHGQPWADVEALDWGPSTLNASNALPIEEFCRYKYVVHTEGIAYSGRFQFLQMCASVVLTPPIQWMQHVTHLARPVFSSDVVGTKAAGGGKGAKGAKGAKGVKGTKNTGWTLSEKVRRAWPVRYKPEEANIVFVAPDWSDLGETVAWLEEHPEIAEGIARRQRNLFVGGGYFSPAAEACYWRALVRGWAKMARTEGQGWEETEGVPFEAFSLTNG